MYQHGHSAFRDVWICLCSSCCNWWSISAAHCLQTALNKAYECVLWRIGGRVGGDGTSEHPDRRRWRLQRPCRYNWLLQSDLQSRRFKARSQWKMMHMTATVLLGVLNDDFVSSSWLSTSSSAMTTFSLVQSVRILKIYISQGSVSTRLSCSGNLNVTFVVTIRKLRIFKLCEYLVKIWTRIWCLPFFDSRRALAKFSSY